MATRFNINEKHVQYVRALLNGNKYQDPKEIVIIHGDGHIFASSENDKTDYQDENGKRESLPLAFAGSNHHKTFNSGFDDFENTSIARYRAIYRKGDKAPESVEDIEKAFFDEANKSLVDQNNAADTRQSNIFRLDDEADEPKKTKAAPKPKSVPETKVSSEKDSEEEKKVQELKDAFDKAQEEVLKAQESGDEASIKVAEDTALQAEIDYNEAVKLAKKSSKSGKK
jgi:hypothetical protein